MNRFLHLTTRFLLLPAVLATVLLAACSGPAKPVTATPAQAADAAAPSVFAVVYRCPDGTVFTTFPRGENAQIDFANRNMSTAAGTNAGSAECVGTDAKDVWESAKLRGVALRAVGTDSGWLLEVAPGRQIVFARDSGAQRTAADAPAPQVDATTHVVVYVARTDAGDLRVEVTPGACSDGSKTAYTGTATISLGGTTWKGCARTL